MREHHFCAIWCVFLIMATPSWTSGSRKFHSSRQQISTNFDGKINNNSAIYTPFAKTIVFQSTKGPFSFVRLSTAGPLSSSKKPNWTSTLQWTTTPLPSLETKSTTFIKNFANNTTTTSFYTTSAGIPTTTISNNLKNITEEYESEAENETIGSFWDGWKNLLTKKFWKLRTQDKHYLMQLLLPIAIGSFVGSMIISLFFLVRCLLNSKRHRKLHPHKLTYYNKAESSDRWTLLEHESSSVDSEEETV